MKIIEVACETNYGYSVDSKVLVTDEGVKDYEALVGRPISFGEHSGKHSEVDGVIEPDGIKITPISDTDAQVLIKHLGYHLSGEDLFYYYDIEEEHGDVLESIAEALPETLKEKLFLHAKETRDWIKNPSIFYEINSLAKILPFHKILEWEDEMAANEDDTLSSDKEAINEAIQTLNRYFEIA